VSATARLVQILHTGEVPPMVLGIVSCKIPTKGRPATELRGCKSGDFVVMSVRHPRMRPIVGPKPAVGPVLRACRIHHGMISSAFVSEAG
jgi:hypothetical protein